MKTEHSLSATCPDDEMVAGFVEDQLSDVERARVEAHLAGCATCLDVVAAALPTLPRPPVDVEPPALTPAVAALPAAREPHRRWRRFAIAAGLVAAAGVGLLAAYRQPMVDRAGPLLARVGTRMLGVPIHAAAIGVAPGGGGVVVTLKDVTIGTQGDSPVRVEEIGVAVALAALFTNEAVLNRVRVVRPVIDLRGVAADAGLPRIDRRPLAALFAKAGAFEVVDAGLVLPVSLMQSLEIDALNGGVERFAGGARLVLHGNFADGQIDVTGTLTDDGERLTLTIGGRGLAAMALPFSNGRLAGTADLRVDVAEVGAARRVNGRLAIHDGRLLGVRPLMLLPVSEASREALARLRPELALDHLPFEDARAIFALRDGVWRLPRVFLTSNGFVAGGRARVAAIGEAAGRGTVRVPADVVEALLPFEPALESFRDQGGTATVPFTINGPILTPRVSLRHR
jgi:hypothetical protein